MLLVVARDPADASVFHAIACPTRRAILDALAGSEQNVTDLVAAVSVTQSAVSQQLAVLRRAGLVDERAEGRFRYYRLRAEPLAEVHGWVSRHRARMVRQLDALGAVLDALPDSDPPKKARPKRAER